MKYTFLLHVFVYAILFLFFAGPVFAVPARNGQEATAPGKGKEMVCKAREKMVKQRMERLELYAANMLEVFGAIAGRVEQYYVSKVVPSGREIANYSTLAADIKTKHDAVETALARAKANNDGFTCDRENPKAVLQDFQTDMKAVKTSLAEYRTSIKNMIVAVHSSKQERME